MCSFHFQVLELQFINVYALVLMEIDKVGTRRDVNIAAVCTFGYFKALGLPLPLFLRRFDEKPRNQIRSN